MIKRFALLSSLCLSLALSACAAGERHAPIDSVKGFKEVREQRLATAAAEAIAAGKTMEALQTYEDLYGKSSGKEDVALNYAQLLRKAGKADRAVAVLAPFAGAGKDGKKFNTKASGLILNEYAAAQIELGNLDLAENALNHVLGEQNQAPMHADANNLMGIIKDAQGYHKQAEELFRKSLAAWKGDATSVMNNLALCLASLGNFDDSLTMLRRALVMNPEKKELARNIEYVEGLRAAVVPTAPLAVRPAAVDKPVPVKKAAPKPAASKPITEDELK